jgi:uncharacterized protein YndB with AHSA1/START domain
MSDRSATHATFVIERTYDAPRARVFAAWADVSAKVQWFGATAEDEHELDFRVGGREHLTARMDDNVYTYDALYEDIVESERIVYGYNMHVNGEKMSVSVATVELRTAGEGTQLIYTEPGVFLDGLDKPEMREHGTAEMLDKLGATLAQEAHAR